MSGVTWRNTIGFLIAKTCHGLESIFLVEIEYILTFLKTWQKNNKPLKIISLNMTHQRFMETFHLDIIHRIPKPFWTFMSPLAFRSYSVWFSPNIEDIAGGLIHFFWRISFSIHGNGKWFLKNGFLHNFMENISVSTFNFNNIQYAWLRPRAFI